MAPPDVVDVLLHATAVAWVRHYLRAHRFKLATTPTSDLCRLTILLRAVAAHINENYEVEQLCLDLPKRLRELVAARGERLKY